MNHRRPPFAALLAATLALAPLPAQEHGVYFTLLLHVPTGDIVLNKPLLDALLGEPDLHDALKAAFGDAFGSIRETDATLPAPHMAGTFQVHVWLRLAGMSPFGDAERARVTDTVVAHLCSRLEAMLVTEPSKRLLERRDQLGARMQLLQREQAALVDDKEQAILLAEKQRRSEAVAEQLTAARIELATALSTQQRLDRMQNEHTQLRDKLGQERDEVLELRKRLRIRLDALESTLAELQRSSHAKREEVDARKAELAAIAAEDQALGKKIDATNERTGDIDRILVAVLEQVPAQALAVQRAEARLAALQQELKAAPSPEAEALVRERMHADTAKLERLSIDLAVTKTLLTEVEGQLARLQPMQWRLLRSRG
ncbi:MAG: hypothetical protein JNL12_05935 [Planctomycetes bacterium]|nr:hypothetical protein [Planctomycetota bacterium]